MALEEGIIQNITALRTIINKAFISICLQSDFLLISFIMTVYATSQGPVEAVDPLKQAGQLPLYSIEPENTEYYHTQSQDRAAIPNNKPTVGQRFHKISSKAGSPLNKAANFIGAEGWWPTTMDKECSKAARILHSFTSEYSP